CEFDDDDESEDEGSGTRALGDRKVIRFSDLLLR
nr:hypothetical protein [Tanacetum cinerariifolium]